MITSFPYHQHQLLENGYHCLHYQFLPSLNQSTDKQLNAGAFAELMYLCYQLGTPKTAISYGEKAIQLGIDHPIFYEVFITLYLDIGDYLKALKKIKMAINVFPDHLPLHHLQQQIQDYMNYDHEAKFEEGSWFWHMNEYLINRDFKEISAALKRTEIEDREEYILQLRYFAASQQEKAFETVMDQYHENFQEVSFSFIDEFYFE